MQKLLAGLGIACLCLCLLMGMGYMNGVEEDMSKVLGNAPLVEGLEAIRFGAMTVPVFALALMLVRKLEKTVVTLAVGGVGVALAFYILSITPVMKDAPIVNPHQQVQALTMLFSIGAVLVCLAELLRARSVKKG